MKTSMQEMKDAGQTARVKRFLSLFALYAIGAVMVALQLRSIL